MIYEECLMVTYAKSQQAQSSKDTAQKKKADDSRTRESGYAEKAQNDNSVRFKLPAFLHPYVNDTPGNEPARLREAPNLTGIPDDTKSRFEEMTGLSFDDVRVHYNSDKPVRLQALAYTQGNQVHIGPGQERHLEHELGHVVQQKEGRVTANSVINGIPLNNSPVLENESDHILSRAPVQKKEASANNVVQRVDWEGMTTGAEREIMGMYIAASNAEKKMGRDS
jgi:hypothetical protein